MIITSKLFDYIKDGSGSEAEAAIEHATGYLGLEIEENHRLRTRNAVLVEALRASKCPRDPHVTVGECQQCGCSNGLLILPVG